MTFIAMARARELFWARAGAERTPGLQANSYSFTPSLLRTQWEVSSGEIISKLGLPQSSVTTHVSIQGEDISIPSLENCSAGREMCTFSGSSVVCIKDQQIGRGSHRGRYGGGLGV